MKYLLSLAILSCIMLTGCNSMYIKPGTLDPDQTFFAQSGGYSMRRSIKERMEERGYRVIVGKAVSETSVDDNETDSDIDIETFKVPKEARYAVKVRERREKFFVPWCMFNGFWWWDFNVSIGDQQTGKEIFTWRGRGCANSSLRKLDDALDQLEMNDSDKPAPWTQKISSVKPG